MSIRIEGTAFEDIQKKKPFEIVLKLEVDFPFVVPTDPVLTSVLILFSYNNGVLPFACLPRYSCCAGKTIDRVANHTDELITDIRVTLNGTTIVVTQLGDAVTVLLDQMYTLIFWTLWILIPVICRSIKVVVGEDNGLDLFKELLLNS
ncbi:hypothetical protein RB195_016780 [Necator americanus]|uniref:Uncharacterized protein n=1 Tax=Necator americanus TaxID=51031 RepID=A0ABR1C4P2_NECAM